MLIEANGTYLVKPEVVGGNADTFIIYVSGTAASAVLTLNHLDEGGNYVPLEDGVLTTPSENQILAGRGANIYVVVTAATGSTAIYLTAKGLS